MQTEQINNIPVQLKTLPNWVGFRVWRDEKENKLKKMPIDIMASIAAKKVDPTQWKDLPAESNNPKTWTDFETVTAWLKTKKTNKKNTYHLGFAFEGSGIIGIDLDHCVDENGIISDFAKEIISAIPSYAELSPSGTGVHILAKCSQKFSNGGLHLPEIEMYQSGRFFTMTGNKLESSFDAVNDCTDAVILLYNRFSVSSEAAKPVLKALNGVNDKEVDSKNSVVRDALCDIILTNSLSDSELIDKAKTSKGGVKFNALWRGDFSGYKSQSEADLALCSSLAFWTADDAGRIDRLFLNCIYITKFTALDQLSLEKFDIEHIATKDLMKELIQQTTDSEGLPISTVACRLCSS